MAIWYEKEAASLRQQEKDMKAMAEEYEKNPPTENRGVMSPRIDLAQHARASPTTMQGC